jgi:hypothetical protein
MIICIDLACTPDSQSSIRLPPGHTGAGLDQVVTILIFD